MKESIGKDDPLHPDNQDRGDRDRVFFDEIAEDYLKKDLSPAARRARRHRLRRTVLSLPVAHLGDVLEVGCGGGFAAEYLRGQYSSYLGIDHSQQLIQAARRLNSNPRATFRVVDVKELDSSRHFDVIFMIGVLHHVEGVEDAIRNTTKHLRPGGWLIANEPQDGNPLITFLRRFRKRLDRKYSDEQVEMSPSRMRSVFSAAGLINIYTARQGYVSTPLAETTLLPTLVAAPLTRVACSVDNWIENLAGSGIGRLAWNVIVAGHLPDAASARKSPSI